MTTALDVINAFIDGGEDQFGDDFILNNKVLYFQSKDWPIAMWVTGQVYINATARGNALMTSEIIHVCSMRGVLYIMTTHEHMLLLLKDRPSNPTEYQSLQQQLIDEKEAHDATRAELNALQETVSLIEAASPGLVEQVTTDAASLEARALPIAGARLPSSG
jgi:hypothetical protein